MLTAVLLLTSLLASQSENEPHAWLGCWKTPEGKEFFWFEPERCGRLRGNKPTFYRVDYERSLVLQINGQRHVLQRTKVPDALQVRPYDLPAGIEVDEDNTDLVRTLAHELGWIDAKRFGRKVPRLENVIAPLEASAAH